jgi:dUTP pyrophosphatase
MQVKVKVLNEHAVIPTYAKSGDAGLDLVATSINVGDNYIEYGTGLAFEIPSGFVGLIFPRSSISNTCLSLSNSVGVVDSGYRGEVKFRFNMDTNSEAPIYVVGDRVGQLVVLPYPKVRLLKVDELSSTERGDGGYGSTGN